MGQLSYAVIGSLDGYLADADGDFGWAEPDAEVHAFANEQQRRVGTYLYGRRAYELMAVWETDPSIAEESPETAEFAEGWQGVDKVVWSTSLDRVWTRRTELRRAFDPGEVARWKDGADADLAVFGPTLARHAFAAGLVDEVQMFVVPLLVGGGLSCWPSRRVGLALREERRFAGGVVWLRYAVTR